MDRAAWSDRPGRKKKKDRLAGSVGELIDMFLAFPLWTQSSGQPERLLAQLITHKGAAEWTTALARHEAEYALTIHKGVGDVARARDA